MATNSVPDAQADEEAKLQAFEKLPMSDQLRTSVLRSEGEDGKETIKQIDVTKLSLEDRRQVLDRILRDTEEDNERFLQKLRDRLDRVGIDLPKIEVRYHHLNIEAEEHLGSRATPSLPNYFQSIVEWPWRKLGFGQRMKTKIISDVSGILKPARLTLLLGPPGSGRTTFLRALSGRLSSELQVSGEVTYNGHDMNEFIPRRTAAYISQYDIQMSPLTVRENLDFYSQIQGVGNRYDMLTELAKREKELGIKAEADVDTFLKATAVTGLSTNLGTDYVMKCMGLDTCANTPIGDAMIRGISGGQKKRVSIAEMLVGPWKAFFMDEISTGLDSSTTFKITKMLQQIAHLMDNTIVVSLLQPPPETFMLFDDLILLAEGQIVYQGPSNDVLEFMAYMGFRCPKRKATADFLQEVTSRKDQEQYWAVNTIPYCYVPVSKFAEGFKMFHIGQSLTKELASPFEKSKSHPAALVRDKYAVSNLVLMKACFARERILMKRSVRIYVSKVIQIATIGTVAGTLFLRTKMHHRTMNDATLYMGALFFTVFFAMAAGVPEISFMAARMPIYHKDKEMFLYPAWALSLPIFFLRIPWTILEAGSLVITVYFLTGLAPEPGRFFTLFLVLILINQGTIGLCRFCAAIGRDKIAADNICTVIYILSVLLGGFVLSRDKMPVWWKWASWGSIIFYGQEAAGVNEYLSKEWEKPYGNNITLGKAALELLGLETGKSWVYISLGALLGFVVLLNILFTLSFHYIDKPPIVRSGTVKAHEALKKGSASGSPKFGIRALQTSPSHRGASEDDGVKKAKKGAVLTFQPLSITFDKINYYVDIPDPKLKEGVSDEKRDKRLQLIHNVSGTFQPGVLTALVGETGAGKTTLLDVLAGRKTVGYIEGEIFISGYPKQQSTFTRIAGYCEQNDIHSPNLTVMESLIFSAWMRLSPEEDLQMFVDEVMSLVELDAIRDFIVGLPGVSGLSAEQRKRLTIAVELVANPSIIFMDEPTSGLDARAAAIVMRAVRNIGDTGRTVVCTIHQPSIDIFEAFDELLLLKRGGQTLYAGPLGQYSEHLIAYFEAIPGVPKINEGSNPATWMMEVSSTSMESRLRVDFAEIYANSAAYEKNAAMVESLKKPARKSRDIEFPTVYAQSFKVQCLACLWKMNISYWRNTTYTGVKILLTTFTALTIGSLYWGLGKKRETQQDVSNLVGAMYCIVVFLGFNSATTILNVVVSERIVYYRERGAGMYSPLTYAFAQFVIELPYNLFQAFLYTVLVYSMIQFELQFAKVLWFFFFMYSTALVFVYYGMLCVAVTSNLVGAVILSTSLFSLFNLFAGFVIPRKQMPVWWSWLSWVMPSAWSVYGLVGSQLADVDTIIALPDSQGQSITVKEFLREYFGYEYSFLKYVAIEQIMTVVCSGLAFALFIKYLNFQRR